MSKDYTYSVKNLNTIKDMRESQEEPEIVKRSDEEPMNRRLQFKQYEELIDETAIYPARGNNLMYPLLKLCGEVGEIHEKLGKHLRDGENAGMGSMINTMMGIGFDNEFREELLKEVGDVLWYLAAISYELDSSLEEVAFKNIDKLQSRKDRGKIKGSGDNR